MIKSGKQLRSALRFAFFVTAATSTAGVAVAQERAAALEEIIVTAQKRDQSLAEIPMSVTVLSGDTIERQRAVSYEDLVALVPGFSLSTSVRGVNRLTLRGINTGGVATTVGVYVDEVPFGSSSGLANGAILSGDFDTFDLDHIEILRGPQGTLYGASALGGVMKYVMNEPSTDGFEGRVQGSVESLSGGDPGYSFTGLVNVPLGERAALRASGYYRDNGGWIDSIGDNPIANPLVPDVNIVDGTRVEDDINSSVAFGGRIAASIDFTDTLSLTLAVLAQNIESDSLSVVDADPVTLKPIHKDVRSRYQDDFTDIEYRVGSATLDWDFGGATLQSITSYATFDEDFVVDIAANSALGAPAAQIATLVSYLQGNDPTRGLSAIQKQTTGTDKFTQEIRLVSPSSDSFEWLFGLYYTEEDSGIDPQDIYAVEAGTDDIVTDLPVLLTGKVLSEYEEIAAFANATWHVTPRFELSFGARASNNDQTASQKLEGLLYDLLVGEVPNFDDAKSSESPFTWSFSPRFAVNDDVSVYARVATGYRPGGPNVIPVGAPPGTPGSYDSDELTNYEVGVKTLLADGRLSFDFAGYYLDWKDVQLLAVVNGIGLNANGGTAVSKGFEFSTTWNPIDDLDLSLNGAYTDAYLTEDTDPIIGGMDGDPLPFVPEWSFGLDGEYGWALSGGSDAYVGGTVSYLDDRPTDFGNRDANGNVIEVDGYTTLNLRAGINFGTWSVELYGKNVTDERGITDVNSPGALPNGAYGLGLIRPRTIGISLGARF